MPLWPPSTRGRFKDNELLVTENSSVLCLKNHLSITLPQGFNEVPVNENLDLLMPLDKVNANGEQQVKFHQQIHIFIVGPEEQTKLVQEGKSINSLKAIDCLHTYKGNKLSWIFVKVLPLEFMVVLGMSVFTDEQVHNIDREDESEDVARDWNEDKDLEGGEGEVIFRGNYQVVFWLQRDCCSKECSLSLDHLKVSN